MDSILDEINKKLPEDVRAYVQELETKQFNGYTMSYGIGRSYHPSDGEYRISFLVNNSPYVVIYIGNHQFDVVRHRYGFFISTKTKIAVWRHVYRLRDTFRYLTEKQSAVPKPYVDKVVEFLSWLPVTEKRYLTATLPKDNIYSYHREQEEVDFMEYNMRLFRPSSIIYDVDSRYHDTWHVTER